MKLEKPNCPKCGQPAVAVWELVPVEAGIVQNEDGEFDWSDDEVSSPVWDASEINLDERGRAEVHCDSGHEWKSKIFGKEPEAGQT